MAVPTKTVETQLRYRTDKRSKNNETVMERSAKKPLEERNRLGTILNSMQSMRSKKKEITESCVSVCSAELIADCHEQFLKTLHHCHDKNTKLYTLYVLFQHFIGPNGTHLKTLLDILFGTKHTKAIKIERILQFKKIISTNTNASCRWR